MNPIRTIDDLEETLSRPSPGARETLRRLQGDVLILGAGGKLGPTLSRMIRRGLDDVGNASRQVIAVSRFSSPLAARALQDAGVHTISCDLTDRTAVAQLPRIPNVIYLVGQKFGTIDAPELTWMTNTFVPGLVAEHFAGSRMVVLSTGCVYPLVPTNGPGSSEGDRLDPPGEYANSCVGRERVFEYFSKKTKTPSVFIRLCYAIDLRYGVLLDLAQKICQHQAIDLSMGATHVIWQGDANARIIQSLDRTAVPPVAVNVTGLERLPIRDLALKLGQILDHEVHFTGREAETAWLWNAQRSYDWFGPPAVSIDEMLQATADWILKGGETLNRPTHFNVRDGKY